MDSSHFPLVYSDVCQKTRQLFTVTFSNLFNFAEAASAIDRYLFWEGR